MENYVKTIRIEALTMLDMAKKQIYPAVSSYVGDLCSALMAKKSVVDLPCAEDEAVIKTLAAANENMMAAVRKLESDLADMPEGERESSQRMAHVVVPDMEAVRRYADEAEKLCSAEYWPFPTYTDLLFSVK